MRVLFYMVGIGVVIVVVMYLTTINIKSPESTAPTTNEQPAKKTDSIAVSDSGESEPDTNTRDPESSNPSADVLSAKYMAYIIALDDGSPADTVLAMFTTKYREYMLQKIGGKQQMLNSLRLMELAKDYQTDKVEIITRTKTILEQDGVYAVLHLKGKLAAVNREVTNIVLFYQEDGVWKLSGEDNSFMDKMFDNKKNE